MAQMSRELDTLSDSDYRKITSLILSECGISFPLAKRVMVEARLRKRAAAVGVASLSAYCDYVRSPPGREDERGYLIDAVTTHKTDFFREPGHFDYLVREVLPELERCCGAGVRQPLLVWSAACSTGEEPYTLAMVLLEHARSPLVEDFRFGIEATDVSLAVLETGRTAVYPASVAGPIPEPLRKRYLLRSRDRVRDQVRLVPDVRSRVTFRQLNLMDAEYGFSRPPDVVFCRNVMIYFDRASQRRILLQVGSTLRDGGYLIMGHAESLNGLDLPLAQVAPTVYRRFDHGV